VHYCIASQFDLLGPFIFMPAHGKDAPLANRCPLK